MEEQTRPAGLESERRELADYVTLQDDGFVEHLDYVVGFLHRNSDYMAMLKHAESLKTSQAQDYKGNALDIAAKLDEKELPTVREYMEILAQYVKGEVDLHSVKVNARKLIRLIPIPDTIYAPPNSEFYKPFGPNGETLADAMEIV